MTAGPLRRIVGVLGLVALSPIAFALATGTLGVEDAAVRALAVGAAVLVVGRIARVVVSATARRFESVSVDAEGDEAREEQLIA
jgi:hypothetical protein